ncbi:hypothetical protein [Halomonas stenophila]|uniref:Stress response protein n=1 Tax=Halomonas stenophila TaxID=795312 RepID=A0A7W5HM66_9GAMM|nr:hypothetical protein [Halomonas stenophila]MBB3231958.1 hypothetical protein [Halomonas stenophila]
MQTSRPEYLAHGARARLIPSISDTKKEERATSILLSTLMAVHEFRQVMLHSVGVRAGNRAKLDAWTEVVFVSEVSGKKKDPQERPDGLLILNTGKKTWRAIIEAKTDNNEVGERQLKVYIDKAKENDVDAVITITNQFAALPTHHPVKLPKTRTKAVDVFHWSWTYVITQAQLLLQSDGIKDEDQRFILKEVVEYFDAKGSGVVGFTSMNSEWPSLVQATHKNAPINKHSDEAINTVSSWHQEQRELCLKMWPLLGQQVELKLPRAHKKDPQNRLVDDCERLAKERQLTATLVIPNAASDLEVTADLMRRSLTCSMKLEAPKDKVSSKARVNWLLRQLPPVTSQDFYIRACRAGRAPDTHQPIEKLRQDPTLLDADNSSAPPISFEVFYHQDLAGNFQKVRKFIEELETAVPLFYEQAGQHLQAWVAPPPKVKKSATLIEEDEAKETGEENQV